MKGRERRKMKGTMNEKKGKGKKESMKVRKSRRNNSLPKEGR